MLKRWAAGLLAVMAIANGGYMLIDAHGWYDTAPGANMTGPFNYHFVWDIGVAFAVAGLGLALRAWREDLWPAAIIGAAFLFGHGLIHVAGLLGGHAEYVFIEWFGIVLPSAVSVWAALPSKGVKHV